MKTGYRCVTNNPLVREQKLTSVEFVEGNVLTLYRYIAEELAAGYRLLSHPLISSIRPDVTPYRTVLLSDEKNRPDPWSLELIEETIRYTEELYSMGSHPKYLDWNDEAKSDFALVDWTIIDNALGIAQLKR